MTAERFPFLCGLCCLFILVRTAGAVITCDAKPVYRGERASIICHFHTDVIHGKEAFFVVRRDVNENPSEILSCKTIQKQQECTIKPGYSIDEQSNGDLTLTILSAQEEHTGTYACQLMSSNSTKLRPCNFTLIGLQTENKTRQGNFTAKNEDKGLQTENKTRQDNFTEETEDEGSETGVIVGVVTGLLILCVIIPAVIIVWRRGKWECLQRLRNLKLKTTEDVDKRPDAKLPSVNDEEGNEDPSTRLVGAQDEQAVRDTFSLNSETTTTPLLNKEIHERTEEENCEPEVPPGDSMRDPETVIEDQQPIRDSSCRTFTSEENVSADTKKTHAKTEENAFTTEQIPANNEGANNKDAENQQTDRNTSFHDTPLKENTSKVPLKRWKITVEKTRETDNAAGENNAEIEDQQAERDTLHTPSSETVQLSSRASGETDTRVEAQQAARVIPFQGSSFEENAPLMSLKTHTMTGQTSRETQQFSADAKGKTDARAEDQSPGDTFCVFSVEENASPLPQRRYKKTEVRISRPELFPAEASEFTGEKDASESGDRTKVDAVNRNVKVSRTDCNSGSPPDFTSRSPPHGEDCTAGRVHQGNVRPHYGTKLESPPLPPRSPKDELFSACKTGDIKKVTFLCSSIDVNCTDTNGETPLHVASRYGYTELVLRLWSMKASVHQKDRKGWTPLHTASFSGAPDVVKCLLQRGVDFNSKANDGSTPLHLACIAEKSNIASKELPIININQHEAVVERLFFTESDVHAVDGRKRTPLHVACSFGNGSIVEMLLSRGAKVERRDRVGRTPLHLASVAGSVPVVNHLLKAGANTEAKDDGGHTPLQLAREAGNTPVVQILYDAQARTRARDTGDQMPHLVNSNAARMGVLHTTTANVGVRDSSGRTKLHLASQTDRMSQVRHLLSTIEDINDKDSSGNTILHIACQAGNESVVRAVVNAKAKLEVKDNEGRTPLHVACQTGSTSIVQLLLRGGAQIKSKDRGGRTSLHVACQSGSTSVVEVLLKAHADTKVRDSNGCTPLHLACENNETSVVKCLLRFGADIEEKNGDGHTPLHVASGNGNKDVVHILLAAGANR